MLSSSIEGKFPFPKDPPFQWTDLDEPVFDPAVHMQVEPPPHYYPHPLTKDVLKPWTNDTTVPVGEVAASVPFRVLSDEGVRQLQAIVASNRAYSRKRTSENPGARQPESLRGLSMRSKWTNEFVNSLDSLASKLAGTRVESHTMMMNRGHINYGKVESGLVVDQWHFDSVTYVFVIMVSDPPEEGGDLQLLISSKETAFKLLESTENNPSEEHLLNVKFPAAGYACFLEGSKVVHHVTPVLKSNTDRVTIVNSYIAVDPFVPDTTVYRSFLDGEPHVAPWDFARHKAWRLSRQLLSYCENTGHTSDTEKLVQPLQNTLKELERTIQMLEGKIIDEKTFYAEIDDKQ